MIFNLPDGSGVAFVCVRGQRRPKCCSVCGTNAGERLCDGRDPGAKKTCDAPLCLRCTVQVQPAEQMDLMGAQQRPDPRDYCPRHAKKKATP